MSFFGIPIRNGLSLGLGTVASLTNGPGFLPSELFYNGTVQGAWYDPSDVAIGWRYNLLTYTEQFDNAAWTKANSTVTANTTTAPDGATTADTLTATAGGGAATVISATTTVSASTQYTYSIYVKAGTATSVQLRFSDVAVGQILATLNLSTGAITLNTSGPYTGVSVSSVDAGNGWWRGIITATQPARTTAAVGLYLLNNGDTAIVWGAQLQTGSTATTYQQIVTPEISYLNYDPDPVLFQDSTGATPVTAVEQPVGLMLDKSKGLVLGSEVVVNGDFSSSANWTLSPGSGGSATISGGTLTLSGGSSSFPSARQDGILTNGKWYRVSIVLSSSVTSGSLALGFGTLAPSKYTLFAAAGTYTLTLFSDGTDVRFIRNSGYTDTAVIDSISVRELPGNHAYQTTSASRPTLRARYNLLTRTEELTNAVWLTTAAFTSITGGQADPVGGTNAFRLVGANKNIYQVTATVSGANYTFRVFVRGDSNGTATLVNANGGTSTTINVTTSWQAFTLAFNAVGTNDGPGIVTSGTLSTIYVAFPDSRATNIGSSIPAYQRVNAATDYTTAGFPPYLFFDGTDDSMLTNSVNFTGTDRMLVVAGVTKNSDAALGMLTELSATLGGNNGTFYLVAPSGAAGNDYSFVSKGTSIVGVSGTAVSPITNVATGIGNIGAPSVTLRLNGVQTATSSITQGTGNFGNYPLYIGRRNNASLPFNGQIYSLIIAGQSYTAGQISSTESWVAAKTPLGTI